jgi:alanine racemase
MKIFLRFFRDGLIELFKSYGHRYHKWSSISWKAAASSFASAIIDENDTLNKREMTGLIVLLYSVIGNNATKYFAYDPKNPVKINYDYLKISDDFGENTQERKV